MKSQATGCADTSDKLDYRIQIAVDSKSPLLALDHQTSNLGVGGSNPSERASNFNYLAKEQKALGSL